MATEGPQARAAAAGAAPVFAGLIADAGTVVEVAEYRGHLIGLHQTALRAAHDAAPPGVQAELQRLYVQEPFTGRGVGTALLHAAEAAARQNGATVLWLTPWVHNRRALDFYAARGYRDHGLTWFHFEGENHENRVFARRLEEG